MAFAGAAGRDRQAGRALACPADRRRAALDPSAGAHLRHHRERRRHAAPIERVRTIYPRYLEKEAAAGPDGLAVLPFREGSPYQGEDLIYDPGQPENFLVRCTRTGAGPTPGMCLYERRIEGADLIVRFPRDWLDGWRAVAAGIERLIAGLAPAGLTSIRGRERMKSAT